MTLLSDIMDFKLLEHHLAAGNVRRQFHPTLRLQILNYTERCAYASAWDQVTLQCRGLIATVGLPSVVVARPFEKFFNYGQNGAPVLDLDASAVVTDKMDGSLGILYPKGDGDFAIATRGSFVSAQARHATALWERHYSRYFVPIPGLTYLFEIVYPDNRIVCDYGSTDDLILLAVIDTGTGLQTKGDPFWPGPRVKQFPYATLAKALDAEPRDGAEGFVIYFPDSNKRIKIKQDDYVALHRVLTNTTVRVLWEYLAVNACKHLIKEPKHWGSRLGLDQRRAEQILAVGNNWLETFLEKVPDEFYDWVKSTVARINREVQELELSLRAKVLWLGRGHERKAFADLVRGDANMGALFLLYDNRDVTTYLWKAVYPEAETPFRHQSEDTA